MQIFFKWMDQWIELNEDDYIETLSPIDFIKIIPTQFSKDEFEENGMFYPQFITIRKNYTEYHIHISQLIWREDLSISTREERY